jgi:hypothetical protein
MCTWGRVHIGSRARVVRKSINYLPTYLPTYLPLIYGLVRGMSASAGGPERKRLRASTRESAGDMYPMSPLRGGSRDRQDSNHRTARNAQMPRQTTRLAGTVANSRSTPMRTMRSMDDPTLAAQPVVRQHRVIPPIGPSSSIYRHAPRARLNAHADAGPRLHSGLPTNRGAELTETLKTSSRPDSGHAGIRRGITAPSPAGLSGLDQRKRCPQKWDHRSHLPCRSHDFQASSGCAWHPNHLQEEPS